MDAGMDGTPEPQEGGSDPLGPARDAASGAIGAARGAASAAGDRLGAARDAAGEKLASAGAATADRVSAAAAQAAEAAAVALKRKPKLRGVSHQWAFFASLLAGGALIVAADTGRATLAVGIYAISLSALFGVSALYHRVDWARPEARRWMRRLDHTMIFFLIAGTYTPFALLVLEGSLADAILVAVWVGAVAGAVVEMVWIEAPKWVAVVVYISLGWIALLALPALWSAMGVAGTLLVGAGGLIYTAGAIVYATQRPDPRPAVFGYHEVFHLFVIAAAALQFAAVAIYALPAA